MDPPAGNGPRPNGRVRRAASIRITKRGAGAMVAGVATTMAGLALALAEATSAGVVMLAATGLTGVAVVVGALFPPALSVRRVIDQTERLPTVGEDLAIDLHIDARRRTATAEVIEVAVDALTVRKGARSVRMAVRPLGRGETSVARYRVALRERGTLRFLPMTWRRTDPLGLYRWSHRVDRGCEILVGPAVVDLDEASKVSLEQLRPRIKTQRTSETDPFEFRELRGYVPGDDFRRVHWASSARRNELMIREPERLFMSPTLPIRVVIDARHSEHAGTLELALSVGASVVQALVEPFEVTVLTDDRTDLATSAEDTMVLLAQVDREAFATRERMPRQGGIACSPDARTEVLITGPHRAAPSESSVVFGAGAFPFEFTHWEPGEPTRRAVASTIAHILASRSMPGSADPFGRVPIVADSSGAPRGA